MPGRRWYIWSDPVDQSSYIKDPQTRRRVALTIINQQEFQWLIVLVAGLGFLSSAYNIFSVNSVFPIVTWIYPNVDQGFKIPALNIAILAGSMIGQVAFGIMADSVGRRKVYGLELIINILATICFAMAANGFQGGSMDIFGWFFFWRLIMGIGVGVEYPLSSAITSESAPTHCRGRMLSAVFFAQSIGQFIAAIVALICIAAFRDSLRGPTPKVSADQLWRLITGIGAIPAALALFFRLRIPEPARYYLENENNSIKAESSLREQYSVTANHISQILAQFNLGAPAIPPGAAPNDIALTERPLPPLPGANRHSAVSRRPVPSGASTLIPSNGPSNHPSANVTPVISPASVPSEPTPNSLRADVSPNHDAIGPAPVINADDENSHQISAAHATENANAESHRRPSRPSAPTSLSIHASRPSNSHAPYHAVPGSGNSTNPRTYRIADDPAPVRKLTFESFGQYLMNDGGLAMLVGTSLSWLLLDFAFYGVNLSAPNIIALVQSPDDYQPPGYQPFFSNTLNSIVILSVGAMLGSSIMLMFVNKQSRKSVQFWGFIRLGFAFIIIGFSYHTWFINRSWGWVVFSFILIQALFNWGPNTTTFIIPAEIFPTPFRCTCHGIASAAGKLGSVLAQIFLGIPGVLKAPYGSARPLPSGSQVQCANGTVLTITETEGAPPSCLDASPAFGHILEIFSIFMFLGALVTWYLIPETSSCEKEEARRPWLNWLDCFRTGFFDSRLQDLSLEEVSVEAEEQSREIQRRIFSIFTRK